MFSPGGVSLVQGGWCAWSGGGCLVQGGSPWSQGGVPGPGGCLVQGGFSLVRGGFSLVRGCVCLVPGGSSWSQGGFSLVPGGFSLVLGGGGSPETPPVNRITDTCKNITLATTSLRPVITQKTLNSFTTYFDYFNILCVCSPNSIILRPPLLFPQTMATLN